MTLIIIGGSKQFNRTAANLSSITIVEQAAKQGHFDTDR